MSLRVVFCTTCKGRTGHLEQTLPQNLRDNPTAIFVVVDYNSRDHLAAYLRDSHADAIARGQLVVYRFTEATAFRMAHAKNLAHRCGIAEGADILVNLDADNFTGPGFADYVADQFASGDRIFLWANRKQPRGVTGRIAVTAATFTLLGGYDEAFATWGPEDIDFTMRLQRTGYRNRAIDERYLNAIKHSDRLRFREYRYAQPNYDIPESLPIPRSSVVNHGRYGLGVVYRNFSPEPMELPAVPTRIFGIGMHRTGTLSLHAALTILGYQSTHWSSARRARQFYEDMTSIGSSPIVDWSYAFSDLPVSILYHELDMAYPGSKFILTTRDDLGWLDSVRRHWLSSDRQEWAKDGFSDQLHEIVYGCTEFDADIFLARYRRHNVEAVEYFSHRPQDLLVMNMSDGAGWHELCGFLRRWIPKVDYPKTHTKEMQQ